MLIPAIRPACRNAFISTLDLYEGYFLPLHLRPYCLAWWDSRKREQVRYNLTNLVTNGNFANGTTGYTFANSGGNVADNTLTMLATAQYGNVLQLFSNPTTYRGHKVYVSMSAKADAADTCMVALNDGVNQDVAWHTGSNTYERLSFVGDVDAGANVLFVVVYDYRAAGWTNIYLKEWLTIDLTAIFGAGLEPTAAEMDYILSSDGTAYWDGARNVLCNPGLKYFWHDYMNGGKNLKLNNMAYSGASGWQGGVPTLGTDAVDDYARHVLSSAVANDSSYSFPVFVKNAANKNTVNLHTTTTLALSIGLDASGYPTATCYDTANNPYTVTDNQNKANIMTNITPVVSITDMKIHLYVNGVLRGSTVIANTIRGFSTISMGTNAATDAYVAANYAVAGLFNKALSASENMQITNGSRRYFGV